jgi:3-oxoacyl-[acyl-carrier protein] reductase
MNIIITGASRGIGYQTVLQFCSNQENHVFAISRNQKNLENLLQEKDRIGLPGKLTLYPFDLRDLESKGSDLFLQLRKRFQHVHVLINNAGLLINKPFEDFSPIDAQSIMNVNFFSPAALIQLLVPLLGGKDFSHIVNISSMGGFQGSSKFPGLSYYSASKAAIASLTECLAEEFKERNVFVNCLALGAVQTEMLGEAFPGYKAPVKPEEMAEWIANFAENGFRLFNGKILPVSVSTP